MRIALFRRSWVKVVLIGLPALLAADALTGLVYRTKSIAEIQIGVPRSGATHRAIVVFPGYVMPGGTLRRAFAPFVADDDALIVVSYAERGVDVRQIFDSVMAALGALKPRELRIYGASMGGMVGKLFLDRYRQAGAPYGKVTLILDSAPSRRADVKRWRILFEVSCWYRGGPLSGVVWAMVSRLGARPPIADGGRQDVVRDARWAGAWVGTPAATSQACFISHFGPLVEGELRDVATQMVYLQGDPPDDDPIVRVSDAITGWRVAFPNIDVVIVTGRSGRWHLPLVEYPHATVRALIETPSP